MRKCMSVISFPIAILENIPLNPPVDPNRLASVEDLASNLDSKSHCKLFYFTGGPYLANMWVIVDDSNVLKEVHSYKRDRPIGSS